MIREKEMKIVSEFLINRPTYLKLVSQPHEQGKFV